MRIVFENSHNTVGTFHNDLKKNPAMSVARKLHIETNVHWIHYEYIIFEAARSVRKQLYRN